ncbi:hypothetical protein [Geopseudomonas aromaticivorans]
MYFFLALAGIGFAAHAQVMREATTVSSFLLHAPFGANAKMVYFVLTACSILASLVLSLSSAWLSVRHENPVGLVAMMASGLVAWLSINACVAGYYAPAAWAALATIAFTVIAAALAAAIALRAPRRHAAPLGA